MGFPDGSDSEESACNARDLGLEDPMEEEMATHSSILAWRIPWTEEPGRLQSMGSQRFGRDRATNTFTFLSCKLGRMRFIKCNWFFTAFREEPESIDCRPLSSSAADS